MTFTRQYLCENCHEIVPVDKVEGHACTSTRTVEVPAEKWMTELSQRVCALEFKLAYLDNDWPGKVVERLEKLEHQAPPKASHSALVDLLHDCRKELVSHDHSASHTTSLALYKDLRDAIGKELQS